MIPKNNTHITFDSSKYYSIYNYNNEDDKALKNFKNVRKFKKRIEEEFKILKNKDFYEYFLNLLEPKNAYEEFISKKKFNLILNDLLSLDPEQRSLKYLKDKLLNNTS
mgnify:CR=1 FL=1